MARYKYDRLSAEDNAFLVGEGPTTPMHVSAIEIFEAGPLRTEDGGIDVERPSGAAYRGGPPSDPPLSAEADLDPHRETVPSGSTTPHFQTSTTTCDT